MVSKFDKAVLGAGAIGLIVIVAYIYVTPIRMETKRYSGKLTSIEYVHGGWFSSVSNTILFFEDNTSFSQNGDYVYALGKNYTITYEVYPSGKAYRVIDVQPIGD